MDFKVRMTQLQIVALFGHLGSTWQEHRWERTFKWDDPHSSHQPLSTAGRLGKNHFCSTRDIPKGQLLLCGSLVNCPMLCQSPCATPQTIHINKHTHKTTCTANSLSVSPSQRIQLTASVKLSATPFFPLSGYTVGRSGLPCLHCMCGMDRWWSLQCSPGGRARCSSDSSQEGCWGRDVCARAAGSLAEQQNLTQDCKATTLQ